MKCRRFKDLLFDYLDDSIAPALRARAEAHLAACEACRQALRQQENLARLLLDGLHRETSSLGLDSAAMGRLLAAVQAAPASSARRPDRQIRWQGFGWPLGLASAALILLCCLHLLSPLPTRAPRPLPQPQASDQTTTVSIHDSFRISTYSFQQQGNMIRDSFTDESCVVEQVF
jgi:anti-sigma factor RsiW